MKSNDEIRKEAVAILRDGWLWRLLIAGFLCSFILQLVAGLLVGTVLGVALFRGVPVGPLIAAGLVSLIVGRQ